MRAITLYDQYDQGLGNTAAKVSAGAGAAASAAGGLITLGVSAQAVPVIGQVLGGISLIAGWIANGRAKAKAAREQKAQVEISNNLLRAELFDLDTKLSQASGIQNKILAEIQRLGLSGVPLNGLGNILKKVFTPGRVAEKELKSAVQQNEALQREYETKLGQLQQIQNTLQQLYNSLVKITGNKQTQNIVIYTALALALATAGYFSYRAITKKKKQ